MKTRKLQAHASSNLVFTLNMNILTKTLRFSFWAHRPIVSIIFWKLVNYMNFKYCWNFKQCNTMILLDNTFFLPSTAPHFCHSTLPLICRNFQQLSKKVCEVGEGSLSFYIIRQFNSKLVWKNFLQHIIWKFIKLSMSFI